MRKNKKHPPIVVGSRFGKLTVVQPPYMGTSGSSNRRTKLVRLSCDCETQDVIASAANLNSGKVRSCGCLRVEKGKDLHTMHGESRTPLFRTWSGMFTRCYNKKAPNYPVYGGRGIRVCDEWQKFEPFRDWAKANGFSQGLHINRKDNDKGYEPENCEWVTGSENQRNRRKQSRTTAFGETKLLVEWAEDERCRVAYQTLFNRIKNGWSPEDAISLSPRALRPKAGLDSDSTGKHGEASEDTTARPGRKKGSVSTYNRRLNSKYWSMRNRCYREKNVNYSDYGGRGIRVCEEWLVGFGPFRDWALASGYEDGLELHREDPDGDYGPNNCRWVTSLENQNARTNNRIIEAWGERRSVADWARDLRAKAASGTILYRLTKGWEPEGAISSPPA